MKKLEVNIKGDGINLNNFAGKEWTEYFGECGCDEVVLKNGKESILLDWKLPYTRYGDKEDEKKFLEYIAKRRKQGWEWCASWGYGLFKKII